MTAVRTAHIVQLGLGGVGRALLAQSLATRGSLASGRSVRLEYVALADSAGCLFARDGLGDPALREALDAKKAGRGVATVSGAAPMRDDGRELLERLAGLENVIVVDVTASLNMEPLLLGATRVGCGLVLANKRPLVAPLPVFRELMQTGRLRHEATVGAGLPVIGTIRYLQETGDEVTAVMGSLSGTVGYLCAQIEDGVPFSTALGQAVALGYPEPDPREDLGGVDVARKALILARLLGWELELSDVAVEGLYPSSWDSLSVPQFRAVCPELDRLFAERAEQAHARGEVLRYVAEVEDHHCRVGLRPIPAGDLLGSVKGTDSVIAIRSRRYPRPLVVCGAGAGVEVTAAAVLEDMIQLAVEYRAEDR